jgi:hypothetical protein
MRSGSGVNIFRFCQFYTACLCQVIHYFNLKQSSSYEWLKPFSILSGLQTPKSIGLEEEADVKKFVKIAKYIFLFMTINMTVSAFLMPFVLSLNAMFTFNSKLIETIFIYISWSLLFAISCNYSVGFIFWQITYI